MSDLVRLVEEHLSVGRWLSPDKAAVECPGCGRDDKCDVLLRDGHAIVRCFRAGCEDACAAATASLNDALVEAGMRARRPDPTAEELRIRAQRKALREISIVASQDVRPRLLRQAPITREQWLAASPLPIPQDPAAHWHLVLRHLFPPVGHGWRRAKGNDLIWAGHLHQSGDPVYADNFRTREDWLECEEAPGPQIALNLFHEPARIDGARQRKHAGLLDYWVLEGDDTPAEQWGPIVQYAVRMIRKQIDPRVRIRAVTDTGGKSLHVLLDEPRFVKRKTSVKDPWSLYFLADQEEADWAWRVRQVMAHLVGLGCDRAMLCGRALTRQWLATSRIPYSMVTTRLPGWLRDHDEEGRGKTGTAWQRLLYLLPKYESPYPQA